MFKLFTFYNYGGFPNKKDNHKKSPEPKTSEESKKTKNQRTIRNREGSRTFQNKRQVPLPFVTATLTGLAQIACMRDAFSPALKRQIGFTGFFWQQRSGFTFRIHRH
jgi:hypothetical protein